MKVHQTISAVNRKKSCSRSAKLGTATLGLRFLKFELELPVLRRFRAMFPDPRAHLDLACRGRFEAAYPETFISMYTLWCCRREDGYRRGEQIPR